MCGIAGIYGLEGIHDTKEVADSLIDAIKHRGPDANGSYSDDDILLSHVRLSIIDIDERSHQPFLDPEGRYVLAFNGEIYNYKEIRSQLPDYNFITNSDTEVLLAAWIKWGVNSLSRLNGMFAFSIWDKKEKELFICRDRLGIKPIYYYEGNSNFIFSSEIRALLNTNLVPRKLANENLAEYLKYQTVQAPRTLVKDVFMIQAGCYLKISEASVEEIKYWSADQAKLIHPETNKENVKKRVNQLLTESVERRLISDVPLGAFLSGGIDSSLLVGVIREKLDKKIDTFSVTFDEKEFSEAPFSRLVAKKFKTNHHEIELSSNDFRDSVSDALDAMDHPSGDGPNSYVVSGAVKNAGLTVALSGLGGDELFAGYPFFKRFLELKNKSYLLSFPRYARNIVAGLIRMQKGDIQGQKIAETLVQPYFDVPHTYPINRRVLTDKDIVSLLGQKVGIDNLFEDLKSRYNFDQPANRLPELSKVSIAELTTYMQSVLLRDTDQMSMAHALEVRVPFLDHNLVEYVIGIPDTIKNPRFPKSLLVESFEGILPDEVVHRPKMGFVLPWNQWMRKELKDMCQASLNYLDQSSYFKSGRAMNLYDQFLSNQSSITWSRIWPLVALGYWMKKNQIE